MTDLKPCPFCGSIPDCGVDFYESHGSEVKLAAVVKCTGCGIYKRVIFKATDPMEHVPFYDFDNAFNGVIKQWNRRKVKNNESPQSPLTDIKPKEIPTMKHTYEYHGEHKNKEKK